MKLTDSSAGKALVLLWKSLINLITGIFNKLWGIINGSLDKHVYEHELMQKLMERGIAIWNDLEGRRKKEGSDLDSLKCTQEWYAKMYAFLDELDMQKGGIDEPESLRKYSDQKALVTEVYRRLTKKNRN